jgi:hypothetical protein
MSVITLVGCGAIPKMAPMLNNKGLDEKVNIKDAGFIAFIPITDYDEEVRIDMKNVSTNETFRLKINPSTTNSIYLGIGPIKVAEKKLDKDLNDNSLFIFQLSPGDYQFQYIYPKRKGPGEKVISERYEIEKGKITSFGEIEITYEKNILQIIKNMRIKSNGKTIDSLLNHFEAYDVNSLDINSAMIDIGFPNE